MQPAPSTDAIIFKAALQALEMVIEGLRNLPRGDGCPASATDHVVAEAMLAKAAELLGHSGRPVVIGTTVIALPRRGVRTGGKRGA